MSDLYQWIAAKLAIFATDLVQKRQIMKHEIITLQDVQLIGIAKQIPFNHLAESSLRRRHGGFPTTIPFGLPRMAAPTSSVQNSEQRGFDGMV